MQRSHETHARKPFRLLTLGGAALVDASGTPVAEQRRRLALLALVASRGNRGVSRDALMASLSPDSPLESARHALHQLIYYIRQQLGDDAFLGTDPLRLNSAVVVSDANEFEEAIDAGALKDAVAGYGGAFLDGFHMGESVEFEEWVAAERSRLAGRYADALVRLAQVADAERDLTAAIEAWRKLVLLDPLSGRAALGLIRALAAAGDREGAIRQAQVHGALVRAEVGRDADPAVTAFAEELRRAEVAPRAGHAPAREPAAGLAGVAAPEPTPVSSPWLRRRLIAAAAAGIAATITLAAVLAPGRSPAPPASMSANRFAVLPFRILSPDSTFAWLREGMVELLTIRLASSDSGDGGVAVVDPSRLLQAWHRQVPDGARDNPAGDVARIARKLGAGRVIEGSVVGAPDHLVLTASLLEMPRGRTVARGSAEGPLDSISAIVDRLATQLLGLSAGVGQARLASLTSPSFPAIRDYLAGRAAFRRGDPDEAVRWLRAAIARDTAFALAGLELARAAVWARDGGGDVGMRVALVGRQRLSGSDRALLDAMAGEFQSTSDMFGRWRAAVNAYPERAETWYSLGDAYIHWGPLAGMADALDRAEHAFRQGWALDSAASGGSAPGGPLVAEPMRHLMQLARLREDTAEVRRLAAQVLAADSSSAMAGSARWHLAELGGAEERASFWSQARQLSQHEVGLVTRFIAWTGVGAADYPAADAEHWRRLRDSDPAFGTYGLTTVALNGGRPADMPRVSEERGWLERQGLRNQVRAALWWDGDPDAAAASLAILERHAQAAPGATSRSRRAQDEDLCTVTLWRAVRSDFSTLERAVQRLRSAPRPGLASPALVASANYRTLCGALLDATRASALRLPEAPSLIGVADSLAREFIFQVCCGQSVPEANLLLARLWESEGNVPRALQAVRRRSGGFLVGPQYLSSLLREEGRLAAASGDTAGAVRAYRHYLMLRHNPEPAIRPRVEQVRQALRELEAE